MRHTLKWIAPLLLPVVVGCDKAPQAPVKQHGDYAMRIESVLPRNWELNESNGEIVLFRKEPITVYGCVGLDVDLLRHPDRMKEFIERYGRKQDYKVRLRMIPKVEFAEYWRLKTANDQITVTKSTMIQNREFYEHDAMRSFDPRYQELPEYYDDHSSVFLETTLHPWECVYPNEAAIESENVLHSLDSLFKLYGPEPRPRSLGWPTAFVAPAPSPSLVGSARAIQKQP
jgi:hypothetical protein